MKQDESSIIDKESFLALVSFFVEEMSKIHNEMKDSITKMVEEVIEE